MSKFLKVLIVLLTIAAVATPAMAELKLNGYFRTQMIGQQLSVADAQSQTMVDQRLRFKWSYDVNDNIKVVHYIEMDTPWGMPSKGGIGGGGQAGADGVNIETKNAYVEIKVPNSDIKAKVGVQGFTLGFDYSIIGNDLAGMTVGTKLSDDASLTLAYFKATEGVKNDNDDTNIYGAKLNLKVAEGAKLGLGALFVDMNAANVTDDAQIYILAAQGSTNVNGLALYAAAAYSGGNNGSGIDYAGYMATAKASGKAGNISYAARVLYYGADDSATDKENNAFQGDISGGAYEFYNEGSEIFLTSKSYNNSGSPRLALNAAYAGNGLVGVVGSVKMKYDSGIYSQLGAGYYTVLKEKGAADTDLGYELVATVGTKIAKKADLSLTGAYAGLGDFYKAAGNEDSLYKINAMLNVSF